MTRTKCPRLYTRPVGLIERVRDTLPPRHRELAKFLVVGGASWVVDTAIFLGLVHTVLAGKPISAKIISGVVSTVFSYLLNREWSFKHRGGRERRHEAVLFFVVNAIALGLSAVPLAVSRYVLNFNIAHHSQVTVSIADFVSAQVIGIAIGMAFRFWAYRRFVFPDELSAPDGLDEPKRSAAY